MFHLRYLPQVTERPLLAGYKDGREKPRGREGQHFNRRVPAI